MSVNVIKIVKNVRITKSVDASIKIECNKEKEHKCGEGKCGDGKCGSDE